MNPKPYDVFCLESEREISLHIGQIDIFSGKRWRFMGFVMADNLETAQKIVKSRIISKLDGILSEPSRAFEGMKEL